MPSRLGRESHELSQFVERNISAKVRAVLQIARRLEVRPSKRNRCVLDLHDVLARPNTDLRVQGLRPAGLFGVNGKIQAARQFVEREVHVELSRYFRRREILHRAADRDA